MIRITTSLLRRSGAQTLLGEHWSDDLGDECRAAAETLVTEALAQCHHEIGAAGCEVVLRIADRHFQCADPPVDRVPLASRPKPYEAIRTAAPYKPGRF